MTTTALKSLYDITDEELEGARASVSMKGTIQEFVVEEAVVDSWDDGRPRMQLTTKVVGGEYEGLFGPRYTLSVGRSEFEKDGKIIKARIAPEVSFLTRVIDLMDGKRPKVSNPSEYDHAMFEEIAEQLTGEHFVGVVNEDKNGYDRITKVYALSSEVLPRNFTPPSLDRFSTKG